MHCLMQSETEAFTPPEYRVAATAYGSYTIAGTYSCVHCTAGARQRPHGGSQGGSRTHTGTVRDSHSNRGCSIPEGEAANSEFPSCVQTRRNGTRRGSEHETRGGAGGCRAAAARGKGTGTGRQRDQFGRGSRRHCGREEELARPNLNLVVSRKGDGGFSWYEFRRRALRFGHLANELRVEEEEEEAGQGTHLRSCRACAAAAAAAPPRRRWRRAE